MNIQCFINVTLISGIHRKKNQNKKSIALNAIQKKKIKFNICTLPFRKRDLSNGKSFHFLKE